MHDDLESLPSAALEHATGGFSFDGATYCDTHFPKPEANQACKAAFAEGASQVATKLGGVPLFGTDGNGAVVPPKR